MDPPRKPARSQGGQTLVQRISSQFLAPAAFQSLGAWIRLGNQPGPEAGKYKCGVESHPQVAIRTSLSDLCVSLQLPLRNPERQIRNSNSTPQPPPVFLLLLALSFYDSSSSPGSAAAQHRYQRVDPFQVISASCWWREMRVCSLIITCRRAGTPSTPSLFKCGALGGLCSA